MKRSPACSGASSSMSAAIATSTGRTTRRARSPILLRLRDSNPSVVVIPALGVFGFGKDKREARITTEFFVNAIHVMAGATALEERDTADALLPQARWPEQAAAFTSLHNYVALPRREAFRIEYWALEEAKLQRMPAGTRVQPEGGAGCRRRQRHRTGGRAHPRAARRARRRRRSERGERDGDLGGGGGVLVAGNGNGGLLSTCRRATASRPRYATPFSPSVASTSWSTPRRSIRLRIPRSPTGSRVGKNAGTSM